VSVGDVPNCRYQLPDQKLTDEVILLENPSKSHFCGTHSPEVQTAFFSFFSSTEGECVEEMQHRS
jgi:hypothetical protein